MIRLALAPLALVTACALRPTTAPPPALEGCRPAPRIVIAAIEADQPATSELAISALADALAAAGLTVLAPGRPAPPSHHGEAVEWAFSGAVERRSSDQALVNLELYSLRDSRTIWAIADARADQPADDFRSSLLRNIEAAVTIFGRDVLDCELEPQ